ncbi:MAG: CbiX/SirB N-terminal domain-containing protein [Thermoanaerobaculia bacterium]
MQAIVLFSHGSVLCGAERNLMELAAFMRERGDAPIVEVAFLNYLPPDLGATIAHCISLGATSVVITPYFLVAGKFVIDDLPAAIARVREEHPSLPIITADVIGFHSAMVDAVIGAIATARPASAWSGERVVEAGSSCRENPRCPLYGSAVCRVHVEVPA